MSHFTALFDAYVLYPAPLRSLLMYLALTDLIRARWTEDIHREWMRSVLRDHPDMTPAQAARIRDLMNAHVPGCLVTGYEELIPALNLPDPDDRHVLAAAIVAGAEVIVTSNLSDFPVDLIGVYGIEAQHPDVFVTHLLELAPGTVCGAVKKQRESLRKPPLTAEGLLAAYQRQGLVQAVARLREFSELL